MPKSTKYYAVKNVSQNRATVCRADESVVRWFGPPGHAIGARIWHGGALTKLSGQQARRGVK